MANSHISITATFASLDDVDISTLTSNAIEFEIKKSEDFEPKRRRVPIKRNRPAGQTASDAILRHATYGAEFVQARAIGWIKGAGYSKNTVWSALARLIEAGKIEQLKDKRATYRFKCDAPKVET